MIEDFKIGNVVILKSGGSLMTIEFIETDCIRTVWFDKAELRRDAFDPVNLVMVSQ